MLRNLQVLTILASKSLSCRSVVQILRSAASKSAPNLPLFTSLTSKSLSRHSMAQILQVQFQKVLRTHGALTILTTKSLSRAGKVQILQSSTSTSAPNPRCFHDFDFHIALAPQRSANFGDILGSEPSAPPRFSELTLRAFEASKLWKNIAFRAIPTRQSFMSRICAVKHLCCSNIDAARPSGNFQYSPKSDS